MTTFIKAFLSCLIALALLPVLSGSDSPENVQATKFNKPVFNKQWF
jgi:hypothetical protein